MNLQALGKGHYAKLSRDHIDKAVAVAHARQKNAVDENRAVSNGAPRDPERALKMQILGCCGEKAAHIFFPKLEWHAFKTGPLDGTPDLGENIDVKTIREDRKNLLIPNEPGRPTIHPEWVYLLVSAEHHPYYWMVGWLWGHEVMVLDDGKKEPEPGRRAYWIKRRQLSPFYKMVKLFN